jgi:hypothetical protein
VIIEDIIAGPKDLAMLDFLSEYEFVSGVSPMNGIIEMLPKDANIIDHITKKCKETYNSRPLICILEKEQ